MADVFISYSKKHERFTADLARELEAMGISTWWDTSLLPDDSFFPQTIRDEITAAKAVIVIWAEHSVKSRWVYSEASEGDEQGKLLQVRDEALDVTKVPMPFRAGNISPLNDRIKIFQALTRRGLKLQGFALPKSPPDISKQPESLAPPHRERIASPNDEVFLPSKDDIKVEPVHRERIASPDRKVFSPSKDEIKTKSVEDSSFIAFYTSMTPSEKNTFWACALGWALDGMDFMIYPLVIGTLIRLWSVDNTSAGFAVTVTLLASAAGGWIAGFISDRIGRVRTLQITILWFSVFSLICAFAQDFYQLIVARTLLGFGFGGEWAAGAVLMGETIRAQYRGRAVGAVQSGWAVGWGLAVLLQAVLFSIFPAEDAWRYMFVAGALPAVLIFFIRRNVSEPSVSAEARAREKAAGNLPAIWEIFQPGIVRTTVLAALMATGAQGGYYAVTAWLPRFLTTERHLSIVGSTGYLAALIIGSFVGYLVAAWMSDKYGRRNLFLIFSLGAIAVVVTYTLAPLSNEVLWVLGFPLGFFASGYFSGMGPFLTELFPTRLRGSGQGFCYNFGRGIGALFPTLVGYISATMTLGTAIAIFAIAAYSLFFLAAFALPETRGKVLRADA